MLLDQVLRLSAFLHVFMEVLEPMLQRFVSWDEHLDNLNMPFESKEDSFDFIIVGGGSSGLQLANRLSENNKVLVLEAGGLPSPLLDLPVFSYLLNNQKPVDWAHRTVPQKHAAWGLNNNPAGRGLGGSSLINGLIYFRGNVQGFDAIAEKTNDTRWRMNNILSYYRKIEDYHGFFNKEFHGTGGAMGIEKAYLTPFTRNLFGAGRELGYQIRDPNHCENTEGFAPMEFYLKFGRRSDAFKGQLKNIMHLRENLVVRKFSFVTKILFDGFEAYGVTYERHGRSMVATAKKEVILSAGTLNSAKLLMLSGIGPASHLKDIGIDLLVDLPVGQSLQDKYGALIGPFIVDDKKSFLRDRDVTSSALLQWFFTGTGPISAGRTEATHTIISEKAKREGRTDAPDIHTYVISASTDSRTELDFGKAFNFNKNSLAYFARPRGKDSFLQLVTLARPQGIGFIQLRDKNPRSPLIIDPKYFENSDDVETIVEGIKFAVKLVEETKSFREIHGHLMRTKFPGCQKHTFKSDVYYECVARHSTLTAYKYCGTAPIGRNRGDPKAVVDSQLRVLGTRRLRVIDGSVFQLTHTSVNDATVRMLGQCAADMILEHWETNKIVGKKTKDRLNAKLSLWHKLIFQNLV